MKKILKCKNVVLKYCTKEALHGINMEIEQDKITALIGPSGCGKSTLLKCFNRMHLDDNATVEGQILFNDQDIYDPKEDMVELRRRIGMVFQQPVPFPLSIYDNVAYGPRIGGVKDKQQLDQIVEESLKQAALWDEVKDDLKKSGLGLSGGQQQRLCIARTLAVKPQVILLDEPTSALDPISSGLIEETLMKLKDEYTIVIVTHNMQQAARISDYTAFMLNGSLIEFNSTKQMFEKPDNQLTDDYLNGRFG
jgi:phosphate transport system ATP-binding protein